MKIINISPTSFGARRHKYNKTYGPSNNPRRNFNEAKQRNPLETRREISSLEEKLSDIFMRKEKCKVKTDGNNCICDDLTYLTYVEDSLKVRIALLESQI